MFVGHAAFAMAAKTSLPKLSLGWILAGAYGLDLIWPLFVLTGAERVEIAPGATAFTPLVFDHYPWSHSLLMSLVWGGLAAGLARAVGRSKGESVVLAGAVVSHWFLDLLMHAPDLPLWPGDSPELGFALWDSIAATLVVEGALFATGIWLYLSSTRSRDKVGSVGFWALVAVLLAIWVSGPWAPTPPSVQALAVSAFAMSLFLIWGGWVDAHREPQGSV